MFKRWALLLLTLIMFMVAMPTGFVSLAETDNIISYLSFDGEQLNVTENFNSSIQNATNVDVSKESQIKVVGSDLALYGKRSLCVNEGMLHFSNISASYDKIFVEMSIRVDEEYDNNVIVSAVSKQPTGYESKIQSFDIFSVSKEKNQNVIKSVDGNVVFNVENNIRYDVKCEFSRNTNLYNIYIENEVVVENSILPCYVYSVEDLFINVEAGESKEIDDLQMYKPYVLLDNIKVYTKGKSYPQAYSSQKINANYDIKVPQVSECENIRVYINELEISFFNKPLEKNGTIYIDIEQLSKCLRMSLKEDKSNKSFELSNEKVTVKGFLNKSKIKVNGYECTLAYAPESINGAICVTPNFLSEALNAKVWWDYQSKMLVITTGSRKNDDILRVVGEKLYMNGEPYYEISFNESDLFRKISAHYNVDSNHLENINTIEEAENTLKQLSDDGFKTIRVYAYSDNYPQLMYDNKSREMYFKALDKMFELLEKYNIKAVVSLGLSQEFLLKNEYVMDLGWIQGTESIVDLVSNSTCESRQNVYDYIEMFITRYKDKKSVLMWEIDNCANIDADIGFKTNKISYSLLQLADFYGDCANEIRKYDESHLISSGDAILRINQWNDFKSVISGTGYTEKHDNNIEQLKALALLNRDMDLVSTKLPEVSENGGNKNENYNYNKDFELIIQNAKAIGKPLYNGEAYCSLDGESTDYLKNTKVFLDSVISSGVQLSYWREFEKTSLSNENNYPNGQYDNNIWLLIKAANKNIKLKYCENKVLDENTTDAWDDVSFDVVEMKNVTNGIDFTEEMSFKSKLIRFAFVGGTAFFVTVICVFALTREKIKRKRKDDIVW